MAEYIERESLLKIVDRRLFELRKEYGPFDHYTDGYDECIDRINEQPTADVVEVKHGMNENCVICNSEIDEKYAGGIWDLAGEIAEIICPECDHDEQDTIYNMIRNYLENQKYCPACGVKRSETNAE